MPTMPTVQWLASTPSTMDVAAAFAHDGAAAGTVIAADEQTAGRGRRGATWASPPGAGLYCSYVARPSSANLSLLTLAAGVGVREGIRDVTGLAVDLKWPNDLVIGRRKLAGILAEGQAIGTPAQAVIIGIGVNVLTSSYPPDIAVRATSLEGELGRPIDRHALLDAVVSRLGERLSQLDDRPGDILRAWRAGSPNAMGTRVSWDGKSGVTAGIDDAGALLIDTGTGVERVIAGELHWML